jgi:hypothetical protein
MTFPVFASGDVLNASDMNGVGLWLVKSQAVGTGVASVAVTSAFSADYDNYLITVDNVDCSATDILTYLTFPTSTGSVYFYSYLAYSMAGANGSGFLNGGTVGLACGLTAPNNNMSQAITLYDPFKASYTVMNTQSMGENFFLIGGGVHRQASSQTGFTLSAGSGTMTGGTIRVYGYRN